MAHIVADTGIPGIYEALSPFGTVELLAPMRLDAGTLANADILIVRSVARVGKELLRDTQIRMVGSATAGTDHVDQAYLRKRGIAFYHAPGANSDSVADYVVTALLNLAVLTGMPLAGMTLGVVGVGQVGRRVARRAIGLGLNVLASDPPLMEAGSKMALHNLSVLLEQADILTLHTPLTSSGPHPTKHLLDAERLARFRGWLINTARGSVVDNTALLQLLSRGEGPTAAVLDVWEGEPRPNRTLAGLVDIGTSHIAGYATDSKEQATRQMAVAVADFLGIPAPDGGAGLPYVPLDAPVSVEERATSLSGSPDSPGASDDRDRPTLEAWLLALARMMCPLDRDQKSFEETLRAPDPGQAFEASRSGYPGRRLMRRHVVTGVPPAYQEAVRTALTCEIQKESA